MKPKLLIGIAVVSAVLLSSVVLAQTQDLSKYKTGSPGFFENKGQIKDQNHAPNPAVKYLFNSPGFNVQLRQTGFSYDTYTDVPVNATPQETAVPGGKNLPQDFTRNYHRVDVDLLGSNPNAQIIAGGQLKTYFNYFTDGSQKGGVSNVHSYTKVTYKDIYPKIDLEYFTPESIQGDVPVEYQFVVHPGGNPSDIKLSYQGANSVSLNENRLIVNVNAGSFNESIPSSYFISNGQKVDVNYNSLGNNVFAFSLPANTAITSDFVIDPRPVLNWGTYFGGSGTDDARAIALDGNSDVFVAGYTTSTNAIATSGEYQTTEAGSDDAFTAEFSSDGTTEYWGTYFGGSANDLAMGIAVDPYGNVFITGFSASTNLPCTSGAYQSTNAGGTYDAYGAEFSSDGTTLEWSSYLGGSGTDESYGIALDGSDDVYITGVTGSTNLPTTTGAYQTASGGGNDAFVAEFNPFNTGSSQLVWSTYYGGSGADNGRGVTVDGNGLVYVTGFTASTNNIATAGSFQSTYQGNTDAYVAQFNPANSGSSQLDWGLYYGGADGYDEGWAITLDGSYNVYITGYTSSNDLPLSTDPFDTTFGTEGVTTFSDAFVAEFSNDGSTLDWGTYYGGGTCSVGGPPAIPPQIEAFGIALDPDGYVYITGYVMPGMCGVNDMVTDTAWQTSLSGYDCVFVARFNPTASGSAQLDWGTFYGGSDYGYGIAVYSDNDVYITGYTSATTGIATAGEWQTTNGGGNDTYIANFTLGSHGRSVSAVTPVTLNNEDINVYPTVQNNSTVLNVAIPNNRTGLVDIYDLVGKKIAEFTLGSGNNHLSLSSSELSQEMYLYKVTLNDNSAKVGKLIWAQ